MQITTLAKESRDVSSFRIPQFEIKIEGAGLPRNVLRDVIEVTYRDSVTELDSFELVLNNWDSAGRKFKYVGSETAADLEGNTEDSQRFKLFEPCGKQVEVKLGYMGAMRTMLTGTFTTIEPTFPSNSAPLLAIRGLNALHQLRRKPYTWSWEEKTDSEIAQNLATLTDEDTSKERFPLPIVIDDQAVQREPRLPYVAQQNQTDLDFLFHRALERGYVMYVLEAEPDRGLERRLYFGPSQAGEGVTRRNVLFELEWGRSLIEFRPTLTTANQVKSVTVNGWDRTKKEAIEVTVDLNDPELNRNQDLYRLLQSCDPREDIVVNEPVFTEDEARQRARAILSDRQKGMVQAKGKTVGLPDLRAGQLVNIAGVGARFGGTYFILETVHTFNDSGYITEFTCRRESDNNNGGANG